jgi:hypothetical protein
VLSLGSQQAPLARPVLGATRQISVLHSGFPNRTPIHVLLEALGALGYENGKAAVIEVLGGEGDSTRLDCRPCAWKFADAHKKIQGIIVAVMPSTRPS